MVEGLTVGKRERKRWSRATERGGRMRGRRQETMVTVIIFLSRPRNCSTHEVTAFEECAFRGLIKSFAVRSPNKYPLGRKDEAANRNSGAENKFGQGTSSRSRVSFPVPSGKLRGADGFAITKATPLIGIRFLFIHHTDRFIVFSSVYALPRSENFRLPCTPFLIATRSMDPISGKFELAVSGSRATANFAKKKKYPVSENPLEKTIAPLPTAIDKYRG